MSIHTALARLVPCPYESCGATAFQSCRSADGYVYGTGYVHRARPEALEEELPGIIREGWSTHNELVALALKEHVDELEVLRLVARVLDGKGRTYEDGLGWML